MSVFYSEERWIDWVDALSSQDYVVIDEFLPAALVQKLQEFLLEKLESEAFEKAGIGALADHTVQSSIRGDFTYWINPKENSYIDQFYEVAEETRQMLKRLCFLPISDYEFHLAHYPESTHYAKHIDQFNERSNRIISMVLYLNPEWKNGDGGELKIFNDSGDFLIEPIYNRCILFNSATVPHQVMHTSKSRYSLTGWFLRQPIGLTYI